MKILITGAAGFVGKSLLDVLSNTEHELYCIVETSKDKEEISSYKNVLEVFVADINLDLSKVYSIKHKIELVVHLAASTKSEEKIHRTNSFGTTNLFNSLCIDSAVKNFIYISTIAVFDAQKRSFPIKVQESPIKIPLNNYCLSKFQAEQFLETSCKDNQIQLTILRLSTVYGESARRNGLFDHLIKMIKRNSFIPRLNWPGNLALIFVKDTSLIILKTIDDCSKGICLKAPINLASENLTLQQITLEIAKKINIPIKPINLPMFFWNILSWVALLSLKLKSFIPHFLYNKVWQLNLLLNNQTYCETSYQSDILKEKLPRMLADGEVEIKVKDD